MMTSEAAAQVWELLEASPGDSGVVARRLHPDSPHDLHAVLDLGDRSRRLRYDRTWSPTRRPPDVAQSQALRTSAEVTADGRLRIELTLTDALFTGTFTTLANDIATTVATADGDDSATTALTGRLGYWQELLRRIGVQGLDTMARRGLFGELHTLHHHLFTQLDPDAVVAAWTGPDAANQDIQLPGCAIEVKTTTGQQPQALVVANERELDGTGSGTLLLLHLSLDERRGGEGATLNSAVRTVEEHLVNHPGARQRFRASLSAAGYLDDQRNLYDEPRYHVREESCYLVGDNFPRITEAQLASGVGAVRYSISLAACQPHRTTIEVMHAAITSGTTAGATRHLDDGQKEGAR